MNTAKDIAQRKVSVSKQDNGLEVLTSSIESMHSVAIGIFVRAGGRYETQPINGISHFLEHLLFRGSTKRSGHEITKAIEGIGGVLNGFTSEECTCYMAKVMADKFAVAFEVLADMFLNSLLKQDDIEKERSIITEELNMYLDQPSQFVGELLNAILWPDHPLGRCLLGTTETLRSLTREDIETYYERHYCPGDTVVAVSGNIAHDSVCAEASKMFSAGKTPKVGAFAPCQVGQTEPKLLWHKKDTEQSHLALGFRGFHRDHPKRHALKLLSTILGENMSSRLFQEVREKRGLAYDIHSSVNYFKDTGYCSISAGVENNRLEEAVTVVMEQLHILKETAVIEEELTRAKEYVIGHLLLGMEKTMNDMLWKGEQLLCRGKVPSIPDIIEKIRKVTPEDITAVAQEVFQAEGVNLAIIGPQVRESEMNGLLAV